MSINETLIIKKVAEKEFSGFYKIFSKLISTEFPEYSQRTTHWMLANDRAFSKGSTRNVLKERFRMAFMAYVNNKPAGFIYGDPQYAGVAFVTWLAVDSRFQRQGVGKALLTRWEKVVKDLGAHVIHLLTDKRNIKFYEKLGYKVLALDQKSFFGRDLYIVRKHMQEPKEENFLK